MFNFLVDSNSDVATELVSLQDHWEDFLNKALEWLKTGGVKLVIGLILLFIFFKIINLISRIVRKTMLSRGRDKTITNVVYKAVRIPCKIIVFLGFLGYVGIDTAGIGTIIASCAVAVGLALQGSLANLAGWCIIIIMRPFRLGDFVEAQGVSGTVEDIRLFYTILISPDNKVIHVPNGALANGNITNYSIKKTRRVEVVYSISYHDDVNKAIALLMQMIEANNDVLKDPAPFVRLSKCNTSGIDITARVWVYAPSYWDTYFNLISEGKRVFDENNITIPYPQLDVHIKDKA